MPRWPVAATALIVGDVDNPPPPPPPPPPPGTVTLGSQRYGTPAHQLFNPASYLNLPRPADAQLAVDPTNDSVIAEIVSEAGLGARPTVNTIKWSGPSYTVTFDVARVPVKLHTQPPATFNRAQQQILVDPGVPIPSTYVNQGTSDDSMFMIELDATGTAVRGHEFWRLRPITPVSFSYLMPDGTTWTGTVAWECTNYWQQTQLATHYGRSRNHNAGTYPNAPLTAASRLDSENTNMSVAAARIPFTGTNITEEDVIRNRIDHLLNLSVVYPQPTVRWWPASSTDGFKAGSPTAEGMRLFFPQSIVISPSLHPIAQLIMQGVRDYGMIILDKAGSLEIDGEPNVHDYFNGTAPSAILNGFPWGSLKVMAHLNTDGTALTDASPFPH